MYQEYHRGLCAAPPRPYTAGGASSMHISQKGSTDNITAATTGQHDCSSELTASRSWMAGSMSYLTKKRRNLTWQHIPGSMSRSPYYKSHCLTRDSILQKCPVRLVREVCMRCTSSCGPCSDTSEDTAKPSAAKMTDHFSPYTGSLYIIPHSAATARNTLASESSRWNQE